MSDTTETGRTETVSLQHNHKQRMTQVQRQTLTAFTRVKPCTNLFDFMGVKGQHLEYESL